MAITEYIKDQLLYNGRITLPGLGTLELVKEPARISGNKINPPGTNVFFNHEIVKDDNKLAESIASGEEINTEDARQSIFEYTDKIVFTLNKGEKFVFEGLGKLYRDENNVYRFDKNPEFIVDYDSFGLESFELENLNEDTTIAGEEEVIRDEEEIVDEGAEQHFEPEFTVGSAEQTQESIPSEPEINSINIEAASKEEEAVADETASQAEPEIVPVTDEIMDSEINVPEFSEPETEIPEQPVEPPAPESPAAPYIRNETVRRKSGIVWIMAGIIAIVAAFFIVKAFNSQPLTKTVIEEKSSTTILPAEEKEPGNEPVDPLGDKEYAEYHIIAGSFMDTLNAQEMSMELTKKGYTVIILNMGTNIYRVSVSSFKNKEEGIERLKQFRADTRNNAAWLLGLE